MDGVINATNERDVMLVVPVQATPLQTTSQYGGGGEVPQRPVRTAVGSNLDRMRIAWKI